MLLQQTFFYHTSSLVYYSTAWQPLPVRLTKVALQPPLPSLILQGLAPNLSHLTSPVLSPHFKPTCLPQECSDNILLLNCLVSQVLLTFCRLLSKPELCGWALCLRFDCIKFALAESRGPQFAEVQPSLSRIHANTLCKGRHLSAGVNAPGLAHDLSSPALKTYWACVLEPHVNARVLLLITMLVTVCSSARETCFTERKDCSVWDEATNKMQAMFFVVRILFSIHHDERVCHFSHGKQLECVTYDWTNNGKYFWYVVFVNKTQKE